MRNRDFTISTRISEAEYEAVKRAAESCGVRIAEWLRDVAVSRVTAPEPVLQTLVEEIIAVRFIVQNLVLYLSTDGKEVRKESLAILVERADALKKERALLLLRPDWLGCPASLGVTMPEQDINPIPITEPSSRNRHPFKCAAVALTLGVAVASFYLTYARLSLLEQKYLPGYLRAAGNFPTAGTYSFFAIEERGLPTLALPKDVREADGHLVLSEAAVARNVGPLHTVLRTMPTATVYRRMKTYIYGGSGVEDLFHASKTLTLYTALTFLVAIYLDWRNNRRRRIGIVRRGPRLLNRFEFNRALASDGIGFRTKQWPTLAEFFCAPSWLRGVIRIPAASESNHLLVMGDSGTGKTTLIRQLLREVEARGEVVILYDPDGTFLAEFYNKDRGDVILNPLDRRCPYWQPAAELASNAEALTLAQSLFPDTPADNQFFVKAPRHIVAHLFQFEPTPQELVAWLASQEEIDVRIQGTEMEAMLSKAAGAQRGGVLASLGIALTAFRLLPAREECETEWSARQWATTRQGWIFLTATKTTHDAQLPLISMWLDTLILRLMTPMADGRRPVPVWMIIDELASLQKLPQLQRALTEARKYQLKMVLGLQGKSQLQERYGSYGATTLLSQAKTKIFFRTNEPEAAEWISRALGEQEIARERVNFSYTGGLQRRRTKSYHVEVKTERAATAAQLEGLPDRHGFIKQENCITAFHLGIVGAEPRVSPLELRDRGGFAALTLPEPYVAIDTQTPLAPRHQEPRPAPRVAPGGLTIASDLYSKPEQQERDRDLALGDIRRFPTPLSTSRPMAPVAAQLHSATGLDPAQAPAASSIEHQAGNPFTGAEQAADDLVW